MSYVGNIMKGKNMKIMVLLFVLMLATGCTSIKVKQLEPSLQISHVCIKNNPKVIVSEFITVVRKGFDRHGITTEVFEGQKPRHCEYHLTYTALKNWDFATYMHHAELHLYRGVKSIGYAEYHLTGKGGLALNKWASVESKMNPVIDKLLANYTPEIVNAYRKPIPNSYEPEENSKSKKLRELKAWYHEGLITEKEYNTEKQKVLSQ